MVIVRISYSYKIWRITKTVVTPICKDAAIGMTNGFNGNPLYRISVRYSHEFYKVAPLPGDSRRDGLIRRICTMNAELLPLPG